MGPRHTLIMGVWGLHTGVPLCMYAYASCQNALHIAVISITSVCPLSRLSLAIHSSSSARFIPIITTVGRFLSISRLCCIIIASYFSFAYLYLCANSFVRHTHTLFQPTVCCGPRYHFQYLPSSTGSFFPPSPLWFRVSAACRFLLRGRSKRAVLSSSSDIIPDIKQQWLPRQKRKHLDPGVSGLRKIPNLRIPKRNEAR